MDIQDLIECDDPGIMLVREWAKQPNANPSRLLPHDPDQAQRTLLHLRVTTRSILGAIVFETGGITVADGLVRLWGSGLDRSLLQANHVAASAAGRDLADILLVGDDAFGGLFAVNGGGFGQGGVGEVFHLPADEETWHSLEVGHADFVAWCLTGDLAMLYGAGTPAERMAHHAKPPFDRVLATYPFAWTLEGRSEGMSVRDIDADEHLRLRIDLTGFGVG